MLESYEQEIIRKRRASRFFWLLVFAFATFLYLFFQGYYPALNITWKQVFQSGGVRELSRDELIRSFGIINVRVYPREAGININGAPFGFDEKKMVPYGKYRLSVGKPGYIQNRVRFEIDRKTPYFISEIHLMPQAQYEKIGSDLTHISRTDEESWVAIEDKTRLIYDKYFLTGSRIPPSGNPIGEGYFLSGNLLYHVENAEWERKSWSGSSALIKKCEGNLVMKEKFLWCQANGEALSDNGYLYKNIRAIYDTYLLGENKLYANKTEYPLNAQENAESLFIQNEGTWYTPNGGLLIPLVSNIRKTAVPLIETTLDTISGLKFFEGGIIAFGKKGKDTFVVFLKNNEVVRIPFPDISLEGLELSKVDGILYMKTNSALLFLYEGSERIEWITEGEILAYSSVAALYRKDGEVWRARWENDEK